MDSTFYHSDDARAMASMAKTNGGTNYDYNRNYNNTNYTNNSTAVPIPPPARTVSRQRTPKWSWISTIYACIGTCICCSVCSTVGLLLSALSYADHKSGDYDRSKRKRIMSYVCTTIAFIIGILAVAAVITVLAAFAEDAENWWNDSKDWIKERMCDMGFKDQCNTTSG